MTCFGWLEVDPDETYVHFMVNQNINGSSGIVSIKDINTTSPSHKHEYFSNLVWTSTQCNIALGDDTGEVFMASREDGSGYATICKYILSPDFSLASDSVFCLEFYELTNAYDILVPYGERVFMVTYEVVFPFWTNFILFDFSSMTLVWKNRIVDYTQGNSLRQAIDYDPVDNLIYSWHVHSYNSDLLMFILNETTGNQHGASYIKFKVQYCIDMSYYNKFVYGIVFSEYSLDNKLLLIVADVSDPNSFTFATYQQTTGHPFHSLFVDETTQRLLIGV